MSGNVVQLFDHARQRPLNGLLVVQAATNGCVPTVIGLYVDGEVVPIRGPQTIPELPEGGDDPERVDLVEQPGYRLSVWRMSLEMSA
ncbi:hypothetical protein ACWDTI_21620 [Gordonia sp. NPDC003424]